MKNEILFYSTVMKNGTSKGELNTFKKKNSKSRYR